jgi:hypothetical protein
MPWRGSLVAKAEYHVTAVITRGGTLAEPAAQVLVDPHAPAARLPVFNVTAPDMRALAPALRGAVAQRFGLAVAVLSVLHARRDEATDDRHTLVALDDLTIPKDGTEPAAGVWLAPEALDSITFAGEAEAVRVRRWLAELRPGFGHAYRLPWTRPGWLAEAAGWVQDTLVQHGLPLAGPIEQQRTWSLSALLRAPLAEGSAYFKALPSFFAAEPRITQALARRFPGVVPAVIAIDDGRAWLLMRSFSGQILQDCADLPVWVEALRVYARLQAATAGDPQTVLALGGPDRRLPLLPEQFSALLTLLDELRIGDDRDLAEDERDALRAVLPLLPAACAALEACGVPYTLEHGDLHGNNIAVTNAGGFVFFDWSDGCLAHPFICLTTFLETVPLEWQAPLIQAYAEEWGAFASPAALARAVRLCRPLGAAHLAVSCGYLLTGTEPDQRWQLGGALPFFLREVLKYKDALH